MLTTSRSLVRVHAAYREALQFSLPSGIAFELNSNITMGCMRLKELPLEFLKDDEYLHRVCGDGGVDGISLDRSRVCQHKDRPRTPIEANDAAYFCYVARRMRDDPLYAGAEFVFCVSTRTHVRSGAKALFEHEGVVLRYLDAPAAPTPGDAPALATDEEVDARIAGAVAMDVKVPRCDVAHVADEALFTASQRRALAAAKAFVTSTDVEWTLQAVGGWGKTSLMRAIIILCFAGKRVLVLANTKDLVSQLRKAFKGLTGVTVMSYQGLLAAIKAGESFAFDAVFCDEAHHVEASNRWRASVEGLRVRDAAEVEAAEASEDGDSSSCGDDEDDDDDGEEDDGEEGDDASSASADSAISGDITPALTGAKVLYFSALFTVRVPDVVVSYEEALAEGRVVDYVVHAVRLRNPTDEVRPVEVADWLQKQRQTLDVFLGRLTLVFWSTSARAIAASAECERLGIASAALTRKSPPDVQQRFAGEENLLREVQKVDVIHLCGMLTEGVNIPFASTVVFGDNRASVKNGFQCMLRGSRTCEDKLDFFNVVAFCSADSDEIAIGAITHMAKTDARLKACFDAASGGGGGDEAARERLRRSGRVRAHVQPPLPGSDEALAFDAQAEADAGFRTLWSATRAQMAGGAFLDGKKLAQYTARAAWIVAQTDPVPRSHPKVTITYTYLHRAYEDSFTPEIFLNTARQIANGKKTSVKIPPSVMEMLKQWRHFDTGIGSGAAAVRAFVDANDRLPKKTEHGSGEHRLATILSNLCTRGKALPSEWVGCAKLEDKHGARQADETPAQRRERKLSVLAAMPSRPTSTKHPLYMMWNNIRNGHTSVPQGHPLRSVAWTGGEEAWAAIDAKNEAVKAALKEKRTAKRQRVEEQSAAAGAAEGAEGAEAGTSS
jgi:superfamily II DNA or RNA helicase